MVPDKTKLKYYSNIMPSLQKVCNEKTAGGTFHDELFNYDEATIFNDFSRQMLIHKINPEKVTIPKIRNKIYSLLKYLATGDETLGEEFDKVIEAKIQSTGNFTKMYEDTQTQIPSKSKPKKIKSEVKPKEAKKKEIKVRAKEAEKKRRGPKTTNSES
jgi:hypothetical protein